MGLKNLFGKLRGGSSSYGDLRSALQNLTNASSQAAQSSMQHVANLGSTVSSGLKSASDILNPNSFGLDDIVVESVDGAPIFTGKLANLYNKLK